MDKLVLTEGELAGILQVSRPTIRRMWWRDQLPAPIRVGVLNRWRKSDIDQWLAEQERNPLYDAEDSHNRKLV